MNNCPTLLSVDIDLLTRNPYQPRVNFDHEKLKQLAQSIKKQGLLQPIVARKVLDHYEIVAGERRWRACQFAQLQTVPVLLRHFTDEASAVAAIAENTERENLGLMELAFAFNRLIEEFSMTHKEIGQLYAIHEKKVTHILRLLKLDERIQVLINQNKLTLGHAKIILSAPINVQVKLANQTIKNSWTVRKLETEVKKLLSPFPPTINKRDTDVISLENQLSSVVGLQTNIQYNKKGQGVVTFKFSSFDELGGLLDRLKVEID